MNLHRLKLFEAIARQSSVTRAAEELYISQPSLSAQLRMLEQELGHMLFLRVGRRLVLTDAGRELFSHAQRILAQIEAAQTALDNLKGLHHGTLRVVATTTAGTYVLPGLLGRFRDQYPGIRVSLDVTNWSHARAVLLRGEADLGVVGAEEDTHLFTVESLWPNDLVAVAAPTHPLARSTHISLQTLASYPVLLREAGSGSRTDFDRIFTSRGLTPVVAMELRHSAAIKQGAAAGLGIALLSRHALDLELQAGVLIVLDVEGFPYKRSWNSIYLRSVPLSPLARLFNQFLHAARA